MNDAHTIVRADTPVRWTVGDGLEPVEVYGTRPPELFSQTVVGNLRFGDRFRFGPDSQEYIALEVPDGTPLGAVQTLLGKPVPAVTAGRLLTVEETQSLLGFVPEVPVVLLPPVVMTFVGTGSPVALAYRTGGPVADEPTVVVTPPGAAA